MEIKKDAIFENVYIQGMLLTFSVHNTLSSKTLNFLKFTALDVNDYNGDINNARVIARKHVLPLPTSTSEGNTWGSRARKGSRVYAIYPHTTSLYPGTVVNNTTWCKGEDNIIVVEFDGEEGETRPSRFLYRMFCRSTSQFFDDTGANSHRHIPARFVTLMPRESPSFKRKRKSTTAGGGAKKRASKVVVTSPGTGHTNTPQQNDTSVDRMLLDMLK